MELPFPLSSWSQRSWECSDSGHSNLQIRRTAILAMPKASEDNRWEVKDLQQLLDDFDAATIEIITVDGGEESVVVRATTDAELMHLLQ